MGTDTAHGVFKHRSPTTNLPLVYNRARSILPRQMGDEYTADKEYTEDELEVNNDGSNITNTESTYMESDSINYKSLIEI